MEEIRQTYFDEANARWKRFQLKMQLNANGGGSGSPQVSVQPKKKRTIKIDANWKCEGNLLTNEACSASEPVPNDSRVNFEGKHRLLCTECSAAFQKVKKLNKKVKKAAEPAPAPQANEEEEEEEEEIN